MSDILLFIRSGWRETKGRRWIFFLTFLSTYAMYHNAKRINELATELKKRDILK